MNEDLKKIENLKGLFASDDITKKLLNSSGKFAGNSLQKGVNLASIVIRATAAEQAGEVANASRLFLAGSPVLRFLGAGAAVIIIAIDVIELIDASKDLKDGSRSKHAAKLREILEKLEKNTADIEAEIKNYENLEKIIVEGNFEILEELEKEIVETEKVIIEPSNESDSKKITEPDNSSSRTDTGSVKFIEKHFV